MLKDNKGGIGLWLACNQCKIMSRLNAIIPVIFHKQRRIYYHG